MYLKGWIVVWWVERGLRGSMYIQSSLLIFSRGRGVLGSCEITRKTSPGYPNPDVQTERAEVSICE